MPEEKSNITRILKIENIVIERDRYNYTVSELQEAKKGANAGELVQRGQSYHPTLEQALMNVRERLRCIEYKEMLDDDITALIEALGKADSRMELIIKGLKGE